MTHMGDLESCSVSVRRNFYISNCGFQHIDQVLKPRPGALFSSEPFISESALSTLNTSTSDDI